jgi:hypothetical protein
LRIGAVAFPICYQTLIARGEKELRYLNSTPTIEMV